MLNTLFILRL